MNLGLDSWLPFALSENQELTYLIQNYLKFKLQLPYTIQQPLTLYHSGSINKQCIVETRKSLILGSSMYRLLTSWSRKKIQIRQLNIRAES